MEIIGHAKTVRLLRKYSRSTKRAQAFIFAGPQSAGKFTVAREWARELITGKEAFGPEDSGEQGLLDLEIVAPLKEEKKGVIKEKEISIEQVREAQKRLSVFPSLGSFRVLIIDDADQISLQGQNALLKTMEEPNSTSIIILVTSRSGKIIPTIRSRCQTLNFGLVDSGEIEAGIRKRSDLPTEAGEIARLAMGRPGMAFRLAADPEEIGWFRRSEKLFQDLSGKKKGSLFEISGELSKNVPDLIRHLEHWLWLTGKGENVEMKGLAARIAEGLERIKGSTASARLILEGTFMD